MDKPIKIICKKDAEELMVHWPSGQVEFHGVWSLWKLIWWAVKNGKKIEVVDSDRD